ncbi:MAG: helix-turn-helix transcriptional regulator [Ruminococcaceae bacterium]|nr:helix-turn-helix transcriptional regulator [Oscillospiraceae bacterium]
MENTLSVLKIRNIFEGEFISGEIAMKKIGRHSDAFACIVSGKVEYLFDGYSFIATPENFVYLAKDSLYAMKIYENSRYICIDFDFEESSETRKSCLFQTASASVKNEFERAFHIWAAKNPWYISDAMSILYSLYSQGIKSLNKEYGKTNQKFSEIVAFILRNYSDSDFGVSAIASFADMSEVHLRRVFKSALNTSPNRYINLLRLEKAKNMLIAANYTIEEIASATGFGDQYYFSRIFKKELGVSPSKYRSQNGKL